MLKEKNITPRNKAASMKKIADAALEIFSTHSYESSSTKKIAEKAGLNSSLIFSYFGSKLGLFKYVFEQAQQNNTFVYTKATYKEKDSFEEELKSFTLFQLQSILNKREALKSMLFLRNYENKYSLNGNYDNRSKYIKDRLNYFISIDKADSTVDTKQFADSFIHMLDGIILTFGVYSNETQDYLIQKIFPIIELICKGVIKK